MNKIEKSVSISDVEAEAEAEALEGVTFWWKHQHLKTCCFRFLSVSKLLFKFSKIFAD
jgi:hypothetical protein